MIGSILQGFQVLEKIKDGSVGTVFKAMNSKNQVYALKVLSEKNSSRPDKKREFKREASLAKSLQHPNIIRVYDYYNGPPRPFFVMEFFLSENLKFAMWHLPQRVYKYEFHILRQVADALSYLHSKGIVHRDLKPENVLVAPDSTIKLIDFSIAQTKIDRMLSFFGSKTAGTPLYMAPEQIQGKKVDRRADIYAFGVMMFELLTKRPPFVGTSVNSIFEKHLNQPPPKMRQYVKTVNPDLDELVTRLLAKKPEERPDNLTTVVYELTKWERQVTQIRTLQVDPGKPVGGGPGGRNN